MSTVIRVVESADGVAHTLQIPGYDTINPVTVPPTGTLDLLTTLSPETLHALQPGLNLAVAEGELTVVETITTAELWTLASGGGGLSATLTSSHIFVGNGSNVATDTAVTGAIAITNAGVTSINSGVVTPSTISTSLSANFVFPNNVTADGVFLAENGSAATPSYSFVNFPTTGIYAASQTLAFSVAGTEYGHFSSSDGSFNTADDIIMGGTQFYWNNGGTFTPNLQLTHGAILANGNGIIFPSFTTTNKNAIPSPTAGQVVFDTTEGTLSTYNGTSWS